MTPINIICVSCKNYIKDGKCKAFEDLIPLVIINGVNPHTSPLEGQENDIVYEKKAPGEADADGWEG